MKTIDLSRRFSTWTKESQGDPELYQYVDHSYNTMSWPQLLERRRVVVLAEAGSGKSTELRNQAALAKSADKFSFYATVQDVSNKGLDRAVGKELSNLKKWRDSEEPAWFFIDSIDEAKNLNTTFESALMELAAGIAGGEARAHIVLTGRHSAWEFVRDLNTLNRELPIPSQPEELVKIDPNELVINAMHAGKSKEKDKTETEQPLVVVMLALNADRIKLFAKGNDVKQCDEFFDALLASNLTSLARRPMDLSWLVGYWLGNNRFGTLREMLGMSLDERLTEANPDRARTDRLTKEKLRSALNRIGAALVLQRLDSIIVPDDDVDLNNSACALDLREILPDWQPAELAQLITRSVFDPAQAGFVRLHSDNQGAVRAFLAARWISELKAQNCAQKTINELLFGTNYGVSLVKPSMAETAAWLSIDDGEIAREVIARDPRLLLERGDPASLPLTVRSAALTSLVDLVKTDQNIAPISIEALRRFSKNDMAAQICELWAQHQNSQAVRELLLRMIWLGEIRDCLGCALEASFGKYQDIYTLHYSARALIAAGGSDEKTRYAAFLRDNFKTLEAEVLWHGIDELFPDYFTVQDLLAAVSIDQIRNHTSSYALSYTGSELAGKLTKAADVSTLLAPLLKFAEGELVEHEIHAQLSTLEAFTCQLLKLSNTAEPPELAVDAAIFLSKAHNYHNNWSSDADGLLAQLNAKPERRRAVFWRAARTLSGSKDMQGRAVTDAYQLEIIGVRPLLTLEDCMWLIADAKETDNETELQLIINTGVQIWRNHGNPPDLMAQFEALAKDKSVIQKTLAEWLTPRVFTPEELAFQLEHERKRNEYSEKSAAQKLAFDESWIKFANDLRGNPQQLRTLSNGKGIDARIYHLWELLHRVQGDKARYSNSDLSSLVPLLGADVVSEFRSALCGFWRSWIPPLRVDRPIETRNTRSNVDLVGILGATLEIEAAEDLSAQLSDDDARLATNYATQELNGFPDWFPKLCQAKPEAVRGVLTYCIRAEWEEEQEGGRDVLREIASSGGPICALVANDVLSLLGASKTVALRTLEPALRILVAGFSDKNHLFELCAKYFSAAEASAEERALHLVALFSLDPARAICILHEIFSATKTEIQKTIALAALPKIFGTRWGYAAVNVKSIDVATLEQLVEFAYGVIRVEEDQDHSVFSPNPRDQAETARSLAFKALVESEGLAAYNAIVSLMQIKGFPIPTEQLKKLAYDRAALDAESAAWASSDVFQFETDFTVVPRNQFDLQRCALSRLSDIQANLLHGDFNQGKVVAKLPHEVDVQNWFAEELRSHQGRSYSVEREPHVAGEKEPDIRLRAKATDASLPIEIKVAHSWSLAQLEEAVEVQLGGRYLRVDGCRCGILLLVHQKPRANGWNLGKRNFIDIDEVASHLQKLADSIAAKGSSSPQMRIFLVNVAQFNV